MLKYDLSDALPIRVLGMDFEPFLGVGPGWTWFDDQDGMTGNLSLGVKSMDIFMTRSPGGVLVELIQIKKN